MIGVLEVAAQCLQSLDGSVVQMECFPVLQLIMIVKIKTYVETMTDNLTDRCLWVRRIFTNKIQIFYLCSLVSQLIFIHNHNVFFIHLEL